MIKQLGKYRIDGVLGTGAMGVVYKAFDPNIERLVAIKTIRKELLSDDEGATLIARFRNEAQAAGRLIHPNIVSVYDYGEDDDTAYLAMEFVEGTPLNTVIGTDVAVEPAIAVAWMTQLLGALEYAHARGVVHRDIKPANILLTPAGQVKVTDFGIAHIESSTLTQVGSMLGTPSYMSPEQFRGETVDGRSDVFSAGVVLYQLLAGKRPFVGPVSTVMQKILNEMPPPPSQINPALPDTFDRVLACALAKAVADRYPSAQAFLAAMLTASAALPSGLATVARGLPADADLTVLAMPQIVAAAKLSLQTPSSPSMNTATGTQVSMSMAAPWLLEAMPELESSLSRQIGPMAKVLLRKFAVHATDVDQLSATLLPHIPSDKGRAQFQEVLDTLRHKVAVHLSIATHATGGVAPTLDAVLVIAAEQSLAVLIGPIAKVVVRRAARQTQDREEFLQLLGTNLASDQERNAFLRDMKMH